MTTIGTARSTRTRRLVRRAILTSCVVAGLGLAALPAQANSPEDVCKMDPTDTGSICAFVTNQVLRFGDQPGIFGAQYIKKTEVRVLRGRHVIDGLGLSLLNGYAYDKFSRSDFGTHATGLITYRGYDRELTAAQVTVRADHEPFADRDPDKRIGLTCESQAFLVCETPPVWMKNRVGSAWYNWLQNNADGPNPVTNVIGFASIESRPLVVKILNMTDQPLVRTGEVRTNGMLRSQMVDDPATVAASVNERTGVGYYHFYRDADRANSATFFYEFENGAASSTLTGGVLEFTVDVDADGTTEASKCVPPTGLMLSVECSVTMIGLADGILTALVAVGV